MIRATDTQSAVLRFCTERCADRWVEGDSWMLMGRYRRQGVFLTVKCVAFTAAASFTFSDIPKISLKKTKNMLMFYVLTGTKVSDLQTELSLDD